MIRIRHPQGTSSFQVDDASTTLSTLQTYIEQQCGISPSDQELKIGYPPKALSLASTSSDTLLSSDGIGVKRGEQVIVARRAGTAPAAAPASSSSSASYGATSSFGAMGGPRPNISTATGPRSSGLGLRTLQDNLTARSPPTSSSSASASKKVTDGSVSVPLRSSQGSLSLKVVPDDNSCLFNSVGYLFSHQLSASTCSDLRQTVASSIRANPTSYPDIVLGQPRESYVSRITSPQTWGGAIELSILSKHFGVEIDSIDVATETVHRFGEDMGYENRGIVIYSGIHYDALELKEGSGEATTIFPNLKAMGLPEEEDEILQAAKDLVKELKKRRYYTDTANFNLKCKTCGKGLTGEKEAVEHAKSTGHGDFGEV